MPEPSGTAIPIVVPSPTPYRRSGVQRLAVKKVVPFKMHGLAEKSSLPVYLIAPSRRGCTATPATPATPANWNAFGVLLVAVYNRANPSGN